MKPGKVVAVHPVEAWRCRNCGYLYEEQEYLLPIRQCPECNGEDVFDRVTQEFEYHPGGDLFLLP